MAEELPTRLPEDVFRSRDFAWMYRTYSEYLFAFIMRIVWGDTAIAMDALQEVFVRVIRFFENFDNKNFVGWVRRIARNCAIDQWRKSGRATQLEEWVEKVAPDPEEHHSATLGVAREDLIRAISVLPGRQRSAVCLFYFRNKDYREIAEIMKMSTKSVGPTLNHARARLRELLRGIQS